ncbi:hypothetical protein [Brevibacterium sp. CS2]|nr:MULTISPECIES: hypothetical protein [Actinomycetes]MCX0276588.1 hypothetical protein [Nocardia zapadnayensis]
MIEEMGMDPISYATVKRWLSIYATEKFRRRLAAALEAQHHPRHHPGCTLT